MSAESGGPNEISTVGSDDQDDTAWLGLVSVGSRGGSASVQGGNRNEPMRIFQPREDVCWGSTRSCTKTCTVVGIDRHGAVVARRDAVNVT